MLKNTQRIIDFIDAYLEKTGKSYITPVEANQLLERAGLLKDSKDRPGLPLRNLLRKGYIPNALQTGGKGSNWKIVKSKSKQISPGKEDQVKKPEREKKTIINNNINEIIDKIKKARDKYRPKNIKCLIIAEAPPSSLDRFFYYENIKTADYLFLGIIEVLYPQLKNEFLARGRPKELKEEILKKFKNDGFYLMDILDYPINLFKGNLSSEFFNLQKRLEKIINKDIPIILIKSTTYNAIFDQLTRAGYKKTVPIEIPFPGQGWQKEFRDRFQKALKFAKIV